VTENNGGGREANADVWLAPWPALQRHGP